MQDTHTGAHTPTDIYRLIIHLRAFALLTSLCFSSQYVIMGEKKNLCVRRKNGKLWLLCKFLKCIECMYWKGHWRLPVLLSNAPSGLRPFFWYVKMRCFEKYMTLNATCEVLRNKYKMSSSNSKALSEQVLSRRGQVIFSLSCSVVLSRAGTFAALHFLRFLLLFNRHTIKSTKMQLPIKTDNQSHGYLNKD